MPSSSRRQRPQLPHAGAGAVMLIGGAEDKLKARRILSTFVRLAGGPEAHIVVVSTASMLGDVTTDTYKEIFTELGAARVSGMRPKERREAEDPKVAATLVEATGVFLTGGNQLRLTSIVAGTRLDSSLHLAHDRGAVIAGTSAGASALAGHMLAFGDSGATPRHGIVQLAAGLGLVPNIVVDQHFEERTRLGRLLSAIAQSPSLIGIGLDEDTAAIVSADRRMEVLGRGAVTVVDGSRMETDAFRLRGRRPMMISGAILHSIPSGYAFDLRARTLVSDEGGTRTEREASE
ncbi:MAG: cyanophycinase [Actinomycetota bacterium]|nr:cyanophycinase [Actinomycetota bacterium]